MGIILGTEANSIILHNNKKLYIILFVLLYLVIEI